jgi:hypothetical protein
MSGARFRAISQATLRQELEATRDRVLAQRYGVSTKTVWLWRRRLGLAPFPQGHDPGTGAGQQALLAALAPGRWYSIQEIRALLPRRRQYLYALLAGLVAQGALTRQGRWYGYHWALAQQSEESGA